MSGTAARWGNGFFLPSSFRLPRLKQLSPRRGAPRPGTLLLAVPLVLLALSGCGDSDGNHSDTSGNATGDVAADQAVVPVRVSLTASRPAGTLDGLPDLTWTLTGPAGLSLVVRAQGPGDSAPGVGFAGVRVASGPVRYLAADGTWSESEVVYAAAAGAGGVIHPTAPLPPEGEWRFDVLAKDAGGTFQSVATVPVLLSSTPALRVSLSRRFAVDGDTVDGSVVLARGAAATPVRLAAWWQGPDGAADRLPAGASLAFDGPSDDVALTLLSKALDGAVPGIWSLVARLFDATTGAPLGYGEQTLQICDGAVPVTGTVVDAAGAPLGSGAALSAVKALSLDRPGGLNAPVDAGGGFSLDLLPGSWLVSGLVINSAGTHVVAPRTLQVTCALRPPLVLTAALQANNPAASRQPALLTPPSEAAPGTGFRSPEQRRADLLGPPPGCQVNSTASLPLLGDVEPTARTLVPRGMYQLMQRVASTELGNATVQALNFTTMEDYENLLTLAGRQQAVGADNLPTSVKLADMIKTDVYGTLEVRHHDATQVNVVLKIIGRGGEPLRTANRLTGTFNIVDAVRSLVQEISTGSRRLQDDVRANMDYPVEPRLSLISGFGSVRPASMHQVTALLSDCDGAVYAGRAVKLLRDPTPFPPSSLGESIVRGVTDAAGKVQFDVELGGGAVGTEEQLMATYVRANGDSAHSAWLRYAVQRGQTGQLGFNPDVPVLRPGRSALLTVSSADPVTGAPQSGQLLSFESSLGGTQQVAAGTTDGAGLASVTVTAGNQVGLGQVVAAIRPTAARVAAAGPALPDPNQATEYLVVSSPAALDFNGPSETVFAGGGVRLTGALQLDGLPMPGTAVTLTSAGSGGTLAATTATVDETGGFEAIFRTPPDGTGSAVVTASVQVEGQTVSRDVPIAWAGAQRKIAFIRTAGGVQQVFTINPDGTGLTQLTTGSDPAYQPAWSPDGSRIAYAKNVHSAWNIYVMKADGTGEVQVTSGNKDQMPTWSPDGLRLAFASFTGLSVIDVDGTNRIPVTTGTEQQDDRWPDWSPDGSLILFGGYRSRTPPTIFVVSPLGGEPTALIADSNVREDWAVWSPDGTRIAYTFYIESRTSPFDGVWIMNADGSGRSQIGLSSSFIYGTPRWSPDGSRLVVGAYDRAIASWTLQVMDADGTHVTLLTEDGITPSWR